MRTTDVTRRNPDRTRERLLEAGFVEIYSRGFQPAGLDAIVERAGVTKGALYHHFPGKHALGYAVLDEVIGRYTDCGGSTRFATPPTLWRDCRHHA